MAEYKMSDDFDKEETSEKTDVVQKFKDLEEAINAISINTPFTKILGLMEQVNNFSKVAADYGLDLNSLMTILMGKDTEERENRNAMIVRLRFQESREASEKEMSELQDVGKEIQGKFNDFDTLGKLLVEEEQEELKKMQETSKRMQSGEAIPQHELDAQIKSREQVELDKKAHAAVREFYEVTTKHHNNLANKASELTNSLAKEDLSPSRRMEISNELKLVQKQQKEHAPIKQRADKHVENLDKLRSQRADEHEIMAKIADNLPDSHPEKTKFKRFAKLKKEEHEAIHTGIELPENPDRDKIIEDRMKYMQQDPNKDKKSKLVAAVRFNAKTTNKCVIDSPNPTPNVTGKRGNVKGR